MNLVTYHTASCCVIILYFGFIWRILLGPFNRAGVVAYHYGVRIVTVSIINMLIFKTILNILFIWDFDQMAAISETKVMAWMFVTTLVSNVGHLIEEVVTRNSRGLNHFSRQCFNAYLGKVGYIATK